MFIVCKPHTKLLYIWGLPNGSNFKKPSMDSCKAKISVPLPSPSVYQNPWGCRKSCLLAQFCQTNADHSSGILTNWNHLDALTEAKKLTLYCFFQQSNHNTGPCGWLHPLTYMTLLEVKWLWNHWLARCIKQLICPGALTGYDEPYLWPRFSNSRQGKFDNCAINLLQCAELSIGGLPLHCCV